MLDDKRRRRVRKIKIFILTFLAAAILIPSLLSIYLGYRVKELKNQVYELQAEKCQETNRAAAASENFNSAEAVLSEEESIRKWEEKKKMETDASNIPGICKVYLTFDDGPSIYTDRILDILDEYQVKATFFVTGERKEAYEEAYKRIVREGHTLGMHSYSHVYKEVYASKDAFIKDVNKLQDYLYDVTGTHPEFYRFPGGSSNRVSTVNMNELTDYLNEIDVTYFDWNISSGDATHHNRSPKAIIEDSTRNLESYGEAVILLHDAADKRTTVEALPGLIEKILSMEDTVIVPITKDTIPIHHVMDVPVQVTKDSESKIKDK